MSNTSESLPEILTQAVTAIQNQQHQQQINQNSQSNVSGSTESFPDIYKWRNILSFWILGLCNNYGYVVMLSAAYDIIKRFDGVSDDKYTDAFAVAISRECLSTPIGIYLLADTMPSLTIAALAPFLPFYINVRMTLACLLSATGFIVVASAQHQWHALVGIAITSFSSGLGETSMLTYSAKFNRNVILAWSSGTGAAGIAGALTYAALIKIGFTPKATLLLMLIVPLMQLTTFCVILKEPNRLFTSSSISSTTSLLDHSLIDQEVSIAQIPLTFRQKIQFFPKLLKYILPLFVVYVGEYIINQGLLDIIYFPNIWLNHADQYRWLQVDYQIGVFVSRSSLSFFETNQLWILSILQFVNVIYFALQAVFMTVPTIWIIFIIVFWEGLLGGCCYVNAYNRISKELPIRYKSFGMGMTTIGQSLGIVLAGSLAIPIHNAICNLPAPSVLG